MCACLRPTLPRMRGSGRWEGKPVSTEATFRDDAESIVMAYLRKPTRRPMRPRQPEFHAASCSRCGTGTRRITFRQVGTEKHTPQREGQSVVNRRARAEGWTAGSTWTPVFLPKTCLRLLRPMPPTNALAVLWSGHMGATKAGVCAMQATRQRAKAARRMREVCIAWAGGWTAPSPGGTADLMVKYFLTTEVFRRKIQ